MRKTNLALAAALLISTGSIAAAQTDTIFGAPGTPAMQVGSIYLTIGPQFQSLGMPRYNLGFAAASGATFVDQGAVITHSVRAQMFGGNFGIGYVFGGLSPAFGANPRIELSGFLVSNSGRSNFGATRSQGGTQLVNGFVADFGCNPCDWTSTLRRSATQYRFLLMVGSDFALAPGWFLTPSIGAVGGRTRVSDSLSQTFADPGSTPGATDFYRADSNTRWWDVGGRAKLVVTYMPEPWIALFIGGHADFTGRHAEFSAGDHYGGSNVGSAISGSATRFNFATGGQIGVTLISGNWLLVSFIGGADYDHRVPRIQRPSTTNFAGTVGTFQTPASLAFSSAVNYSAQVKVTIRIF